MRKNLYIIALALLSIVFATGCEKEYDIRRIDTSFSNALTAQYPNALWVEWERNYDWYVAEFYDNGTQLKVWFDKQAQWCMTETDLGRDLKSLPAAVQSTFENSNYATWMIDGLDKYERTDGTYYLIEIDLEGKKDRELYFSESGTLLKDSTEKGEFRPNTKL